jgi:hypothetical protein
MIKFEFLGQTRARYFLTVLGMDFPLVLSFPELFCKSKVNVIYHNTGIRMSVLTLDETIEIERAANGLGTV